MVFEVLIDRSEPGVRWRIDHVSKALDSLLAYFDQDEGIPTQRNGTFAVRTHSWRTDEQVRTILEGFEGITIDREHDQSLVGDVTFFG